MKTKHLSKKIIVTVFLLLAPFVVLGYNSQCQLKMSVSKGTGSVSIDINKFMSCAEERYGYDVNTLRRASQKNVAPSADLYFNNPSPKTGERVTATAVPANFKSTNENLYFTWFLVRDSDKKDNNLMKNAKARAMGIVARGSYDPALFGEKYDGTNDDGNDDGFDAPYGGADGVGGKTSGGDLGKFEQDIMTTKQTVDSSDITRCYRHNFGGSNSEMDQYDSGNDLIIACEHEFIERTSECSQGDKLGNGKFGTAEEACWKTDPTNPDTDGDGIIDEADLVGLAQDEFAWDYQPGDRVGVIIEGTSNIQINEDESSGSDDTSAGQTSYHKIMWTGLEICNKDSKDLFPKDDCDGSDDYGYTYLATKLVAEEGQQNLETTLSVTPDSPQYDRIDPNLSDEITINSVITNDPANNNYLYYQWSVYRCKSNDFENCATTGVEITKKCDDDEDEQLEKCAVNESGEPYFESDSYRQGMGISQISFKPLETLMDEGDQSDQTKEYFKVFLSTKRFKEDKRMSVSSILVAVDKNDFGIKLYKVSPQSDGTFGFNTNTDEICNEGIYRKVCPVYPNQVIAAKAYYAKGSLGNTKISYNWSLGGELIPPAKSCEIFEGNGNNACTLGDTIFFPAINEDLFMGEISVLVKREEDEDLMASRAYSINSPMAMIYSEDYGTAWPTTLADSTEAEAFFESYPNNVVTFRAEIIPDYLKIGKEVSLAWNIDGNKVTEDFIENNPEFEISFPADNKISYKVLGKTGGVKTLSANVEKMFSFDEKLALKKGWDIDEVGNLSNDGSVSVKLIYPEAEDLGLDEPTASLGIFLASTAHNAPYYLKSIIQLAVLLVIIWSILFGFSYVVNPRKII